MALDRSQIPAPVLPKEAVPVPSLGGEVIVHGLLLRDRLRLFAEAREEGAVRYASVSSMLAATVTGGDGKPLYTVDEWETFGALHLDEALDLFAVAKRLSGLDSEDAEKN